MKKIIFLSILLLSLASTKDSVLAVPPTLTSLTPSQGAVGKEVILNGFSYCSGSEIVFYEDQAGVTEKARAAANYVPVVINGIQINCDNPQAIPKQTASNFTFSVPNLATGVYWVKLSHNDLGASESKTFTIVPKVTSISFGAVPLDKITHLTPLEINGQGFPVDPTKSRLLFYGFPIDSYPLSAISTKLTLNLYSPFIFPIATYEVPDVRTSINNNWYNSDFAPNINRTFVLRPHLNNLTPNRLSAGSTFSITGIYFHQNNQKVWVRFYQGGVKKLEIHPAQISADGGALEAQVLSTLEAGNYDIKVAVLDANNASNWIESDNSFPFTVTLAPGTLTIASLQPSGSIFNTSPTLSLQTNLAANCKYDTENEFYNNMRNNFSTTGGTSHSQSLGALALGSYTYYVGCSATPATGYTAVGYANTAFQIIAPPVVIIPETTISNPRPAGTITTVLPYTANLQVDTNENATCKLDSSDKSFDEMQWTFNQTGGTTHSINSAPINSYRESTFYVRCQDSAGNKNLSSTLIRFTLVTPSTTPPITPPSTVCRENEICNPLQATSLTDLINSIIKFILWISLALAPLMVTFGAILLVTSAGNPQQIEKAKHLIWYTVIGLAIILLAKGLVSVLKQIIG